MLRGVAVILLLAAPCHGGEQLVEQVNSCKAVFPDGTVDLWSLDGLNNTGPPRFRNFATVLIAGIRYNLTYNPCSGFQCNSDLKAAVCAVDIYGIGLRYDVASQTGDSVFQVNSTLVQIRYASSDKAQGRDFVTLVTLACTTSDEDTLTNVELTDANVLTFQLNSKHSCLIPHPAAISGWSIGDYIVLAFCLVVFLYFVLFLGINKLVLQRSGLDLLPHRHAWANLALLVKDGCVFTFSAVRGRCTQRAGYSEI